MTVSNIKQKLHLRDLSRKEVIHLICATTFYFAWFGVIISTSLFLAYINTSTLGQIIFGLLAIGSFPSLLYLLNLIKVEERDSYDSKK